MPSFIAVPCQMPALSLERPVTLAKPLDSILALAWASVAIAAVFAVAPALSPAFAAGTVWAVEGADGLFCANAVPAIRPTAAMARITERMLSSLQWMCGLVEREQNSRARGSVPG